MRVSEDGLALLRRFEGLRLKAYQDQGGVWTVGYGATGPGIQQGTEWSEAQAEEQLQHRCEAISSILSGCVKPMLAQHQFDALVSFCYNVGQGAFRGSTLLRKLNQRDFPGAADEFLRWDKVHGVPTPGLAKRRAAERDLFLGGKIQNGSQTA